MGLKEDFDKAAEEAKALPASTSQEDQLILYGLFKQVGARAAVRLIARGNVCVSARVRVRVRVRAFARGRGVGAGLTRAPSTPPPLHPSLSPSVARTRPQANIGDNTAPKPGMLDFKGKAKWEAYSKNKGMSKDEAMENYIAKVAELQEA